MTEWLLCVLVGLLGVDRWVIRARSARELKNLKRLHARERDAMRAELDVAHTLVHLWEMRAHKHEEGHRDTAS